MSRSNVALKLLLSTDPYDTFTSLIYKVRKDGSDVSYGRGIKLAGEEPTEGELEAFLDSIIATCKEKF